MMMINSDEYAVAVVAYTAAAAAMSTAGSVWKNETALVRDFYAHYRVFIEHNFGPDTENEVREEYRALAAKAARAHEAYCAAHAAYCEAYHALCKVSK